MDSDFDEKPLHFLNLEPVSLVKHIASAKLDYAVEQFKERLNADDTLFTADTVVFLDNKTVYGKPQSKEAAIAMLRSYSGKTHKVATAIAGYSKAKNKSLVACSLSKLKFARLSARDIDMLIENNEWQNVAGAYRIQGRAAFFVKKLIGSYSGVVGLPLYEFFTLAKKLKAV